MFCLFLYPAVGYCSDGRGCGGGFTLETFGKQGEGGYTSHFVPRLHFVTLATSKWILIVPLRAGPLSRTPKPQPLEKKCSSHPVFVFGSRPRVLKGPSWRLAKDAVKRHHWS